MLLHTCVTGFAPSAAGIDGSGRRLRLLAVQQPDAPAIGPLDRSGEETGCGGGSEGQMPQPSALSTRQVRRSQWGLSTGCDRGKVVFIINISLYRYIHSFISLPHQRHDDEYGDIGLSIELYISISISISDPTHVIAS